MQWVPELSIAVIAASRWGNTILEAATAKAVELSREADLLRLAELVNDILFADLPDAVGHATRMLEEKAATANDVGQLLEAHPVTGGHRPLRQRAPNRRRDGRPRP